MSSVCCLISLLFQIRIKICIFRTGNFFFHSGIEIFDFLICYIRIFGYLSHCHNIDIRSLRFPFWNLLIQQTDIIGNIVYIINTKPDKNIFISFHLLLQDLQGSISKPFIPHSNLTYPCDVIVLHNIFHHICSGISDHNSLSHYRLCRITQFRIYNISLISYICPYSVIISLS